MATSDKDTGIVGYNVQIAVDTSQFSKAIKRYSVKLTPSHQRVSRVLSNREVLHARSY